MNRKLSIAVEKIIGHADTLSKIPSQDATTDQAHASTRDAEAKHPTQNDESKHRERPNRPRTLEGKEPATHQKWQTRPKSQQQQLYARDDEQERSQQSFDFVQIVYQTKCIEIPK